MHDFWKNIGAGKQVRGFKTNVLNIYKRICIEPCEKCHSIFSLRARTNLQKNEKKFLQTCRLTRLLVKQNRRARELIRRQRGAIESLSKAAALKPRRAFNRDLRQFSRARWSEKAGRRCESAREMKIFWTLVAFLLLSLGMTRALEMPPPVDR